ncbi:MAG: phosphatase PAP2 family protein [Gammaproteobacteria bacterium]|nr:phosphatase PAP2 family protein [Gammaproteobacteria bacterium]
MKQHLAWSVVLALTLLTGAPSTTFASDTQKAGDALLVLIPLTGFATATIKRDREGQVQFIKAFVANAAITGALKSAIDKRRPNGNCCESFPSGHASISFMGATFLQKRYGRKLGIPAYAAATFVAYSRVESDKHFVEDVIAGAAIGYLSSYFFTTPYKGVAIAPVTGRDFVGITFSKAW